jgi:acyl-CoA synthetase (AMP-forming)/AMP-acid ligase II
MTNSTASEKPPKGIHESSAMDEQSRPCAIQVIPRSPPFDLTTTLTFDAIAYWAKTDPHRTALIVAEKQWKAENGKLTEKHSVDNEQEWSTVTYYDFYQQVNRYRAALHHAGVPLPSSKDQKPYRILLLFAPSNRAQVLALLIALQAANCILLFGTPDAFGGIRNFLETMLKLEPDAVVCSRMVYTVFRSISMTLGTSSTRKPLWIKSTALTKVLNDTQMQQFTTAAQQGLSPITLDTVATIMFSSGTTGPPSPIEVSHRMLCFQAAGYAQMLQKHFGQGIIRENTTITGVIGEEYSEVLTSKRNGPWISTHVFVNFVMLDLVLGGTAVMQPMGLSSSDKTVDADALLTLWDHFDTKITSAPPALWARLLKLKRQREKVEKRRLVESLQMAFVGGAETSASFAAELAHAFLPHDNNISTSGLYRVYGTTQVLPVAIASYSDIRHDEEANSGGMCAKGYGVCLGSIVAGLDVTIDTQKWASIGGQSQLLLSHSSLLEIGELCVMGNAISPSMEVVSKNTHDEHAPTRIFRSGDICYLEPNTRHIYFLGRMSQAVDCGSQLKMVPPVGVEMIALETKTIQRCAFVGVRHSKTWTRCAFVGVRHSKTWTVSPTLVVQFDHDDTTSRNEKKAHMDAARKAIRRGLERSIWAPILQHCELTLVAYSKSWPVDCRHSSKTNRFMLRDWAARVDAHKIHSI